MGRKSQQSQTLDNDRERMERLSEMGVLSSRSSTRHGRGVDVGKGLSFDGSGWDKDAKEGGVGPRVTPSNTYVTHGIMKTSRILSPGISVQHSRSTNTKMVDPKPSVRFTLDLPPKLDVNFNFSGVSLDEELGKSQEVKKEGRKTPGWAEETTAAVLDRSRFVVVNEKTSEQKEENEGEKRKERRNCPPRLENDAVTTPTVANPQAAGQHQPNDEAKVNGAFSPLEVPSLDPTEAGLTIDRSEDLARMGARLPRGTSSRRKSFVYAAVSGQAPSLRTPSGTSSSGKRYFSRACAETLNFC
jgi:hypothetical protein